MLIQLAAATAAKGTNRPIRGEMCYSRREEAENMEGRHEKVHSVRQGKPDLWKSEHFLFLLLIFQMLHMQARS